MRISLIILCAIIISGAAALAISDLYVSGDWRYKMTVYVDTPEGVKTGSAVREVSMAQSAIRLDLPEATTPVHFKGEAVAVDLGKRGILFALVSDKSKYLVHELFPPDHSKGVADSIRHYRSLPAGQTQELPQQLYPEFVTFTDMNDPKSVGVPYGLAGCERNIPECNGSRKGMYEKINRMEEFFGPGVKIKNIEIEITDEPVTNTAILEQLPKFDDEFWEWRKTLRFSDPRKIGAYSFSKGEKE